MCFTQNTGGFFCALIEKLADDASAERRVAHEAVPAADTLLSAHLDGVSPAGTHQHQRTGRFTRPPPAHCGTNNRYVPIKSDSALANELTAFYGLPADFPWSRRS